MRLAEHTILLNGKLESVWQKLVDWERMPDWDKFLKTVHFDGPLAAGSIGELVLQNGQKVRLRITSFAPNKKYVDEFYTLGSRFIFYHELIEHQDNQIEVHFWIDAEGLFAFLFQIPMSNDFQAKLPTILSNFKTQFEAAYS